MGNWQREMGNLLMKPRLSVALSALCTFIFFLGQIILSGASNRIFN